MVRTLHEHRPHESMTQGKQPEQTTTTALQDERAPRKTFRTQTTFTPFSVRCLLGEMGSTGPLYCVSLCAESFCILIYSVINYTVLYNPPVNTNSSLHWDQNRGNVRWYVTCPSRLDISVRQHGVTKVNPRIYSPHHQPIRSQNVPPK